MSGKAFRDTYYFLAVLQHFLKPIHLHHLRRRLQQSRRRSHSSNKCIPSIILLLWFARRNNYHININNNDQIYVCVCFKAHATTLYAPNSELMHTVYLSFMLGEFQLAFIQRVLCFLQSLLQSHAQLLLNDKTTNIRTVRMKLVSHLNYQSVQFLFLLINLCEKPI